MLIPKKDDKQCLISCSDDVKKMGGCSCLNRIREELLKEKNRNKQQLNG